jgi:hypothetical protein
MDITKPFFQESITAAFGGGFVFHDCLNRLIGGGKG